MAVAEQDRRAALVLTDLHGLRDAAVSDALQDLVLTAGGTVGGLPGLVRGHLLDEVDPDPALFLDQPVVTRGETVLPAGARVQRAWLEFPVVPEAQVGSGVADADLLHQLLEQLCRVGRDPPALPLRRLPEQVVPDLVEAARPVVAAVDIEALELVEAADQPRPMKEHGRLDEGIRRGSMWLARAARSNWPLSSLHFRSVRCSGFFRVRTRSAWNCQVSPWLTTRPGCP